jgi:hypothetical protein
MAKRQDSGSNSAHQNQRPTSHNEDAVPDNTENVRGIGSDDDDFDDDDLDDDSDDEEADEEENEGSF